MKILTSNLQPGNYTSIYLTEQVPEGAVWTKEPPAGADTNEIMKSSYLVEDGEDFGMVLETLKNVKTGSMFRAVVPDVENGRIDVYTSVHGIWRMGEHEFQKKVEAKSKEKGEVRLSYTLRRITNPLELLNEKSLSRSTFPIYEDAEALLRAGAVEQIHKATEREREGEFIDDAEAYRVYDYHFHQVLTEEDLAKIEARQAAREERKEETTHVGKGGATLSETADTKKKNEEEIHTDQSKEVESGSAEKIVEKSQDALAEWQKRMIEKKEKEFRVEKEKILAAAKDAQAAKGVIVGNLVAGANLEEAIQEAKSSKFTTYAIAAASEMIKTDLLTSEQRERQIIELQKETSKIPALEAKLEASEGARKRNYDSYQYELRQRRIVEAERDAIKKGFDELELKAKRALSSAKQKVSRLEAELADLIEEKAEADKHISQLEAELEQRATKEAELENRISKLEAELEQRATKEAELEQRAKKEEERAAAAEKRAAEADKRVAQLEAELKRRATKEAELKRVAKKEEERAAAAEKRLDGLSKQLERLAAVVEKIERENSAMRAKLDELSEVKKENARLRAELAEVSLEVEHEQDKPQNRNSDDLLALVDEAFSGGDEKEEEDEQLEE